jgi:hypothetical protein
MCDLTIRSLDKCGTREQRERDLEARGSDSAKSGFPHIFRTWLSRHVDVQARSFQVSVAGSIYEGQMKVAAVLRGLPADERSDKQREFGTLRQLCFDLSRSLEPVNCFDFDCEVSVALISPDLDQGIDTTVCGVRLVRDNGGQAGATIQGHQSGVQDFFGNATLVHRYILYT